MNTNKKLIMVSVWFRGIRKTVFVYATVGLDGRYKYEGYNSLAKSLGAQTGDTYSLT